MASSDDRPKTITGGCVCASVRYTVTFPPDHDFANSCEQCRKNTGSLIFRSHKVPKSAVAFTARSTLRLYSATPHCERGFCSGCGSFLLWQRDDRDYTCLTVGCFDAAVLARHGPLLTAARRHLFCAREVPGVTDHLEGERFAGDDE
ncbi:Mss4-like protein [Trichoderma gracile]